MCHLPDDVMMDGASATEPAFSESTPLYSCRKPLELMTRFVIILINFFYPHSNTDELCVVLVYIWMFEMQFCWHMLWNSYTISNRWSWVQKPLLSDDVSSISWKKRTPDMEFRKFFLVHYHFCLKLKKNNFTFCFVEGLFGENNVYISVNLVTNCVPCWFVIIVK